MIGSILLTPLGGQRDTPDPICKVFCCFPLMKSGHGAGLATGDSNPSAILPPAFAAILLGTAFVLIISFALGKLPRMKLSHAMVIGVLKQTVVRGYAVNAAGGEGSRKVGSTGWLCISPTHSNVTIPKSFGIKSPQVFVGFAALSNPGLNQAPTFLWGLACVAGWPQFVPALFRIQPRSECRKARPDPAPTLGADALALAF